MAEDRALQRMTRRDLVAEIKRLRGALAERLALTRVVRELRACQEELAEQRGGLLDVRRQLERSRDVEGERGRLIQDDARLRAAMEARDEFLSVLSHELRTPLTPILAITSALHAHADVPLAIRENLARIKRNVELETRLIDDLLDMTEAARGRMPLSREIVDLHQVLRDTVVLCEADRPPGIAMTLALGARQHHVRADAMRLRQIFWNLVRNAFQSIGTDGEISLRSTNDASGRITLTVRDSGCGIDGADLDGIFLPFYQPRGDGRGRFGLQLAISKLLVEAHEGRIAATSPGRGQGACFEIELGVAPVAMENDGRRALPSPSQTPAENSAPPPARLAILLVEDNVDSADALATALRLEGFDVRLAGSLAAAREAVRERFDVLVSDLALPDGSGLDLIAELRTHTAIPAIALSGYGSERDRKTSVAAGFSTHLTKPVTIERLSEAIRGLVPATARRSDQAG